MKASMRFGQDDDSQNPADPVNQLMGQESASSSSSSLRNPLWRTDRTIMPQVYVHTVHLCKSLL